MFLSNSRLLSIAACGFAVAPIACAPKNSTTQPSTQPTTQQVVLPAPPPSFRDILLPKPQPTRLTIWEIAVPTGGISRNETFWNATDKSAIPAATRELMLRNGIRVSEINEKDWPRIRDLLDTVHANSKHNAFSGSPTQTIELPLKQSVPFQNIFSFDKTGALAGQSFDVSDNFLSITFEPSQHELGTSHISFYPLIRSQRTRIQYTIRNNQDEIEFIHPERMFDLGFSVDLPHGRVLLIGPGEGANNESTLGNALLVQQTPAEITETLLVILPASFGEK